MELQIQTTRTTTLLLEWLKSKPLTSPNAGKDVEQQEPSLMLVGVQNGTATLEEFGSFLQN